MCILIEPSVKLHLEKIDLEKLAGTSTSFPKTNLVNLYESLTILKLDYITMSIFFPLDTSNWFKGR